MKLILVEDDVQLGGALHAVLMGHGYTVTWVTSAEDARRFLASEPFDLMLLDIVLPLQSGLELLAWARGKRLSLPILILTARDSIGDRVQGLDGGADDYLVKPFDIDELFSRCRALLRRGGGQAATVWIFGALVVDTGRRRVALDGIDVPLARREFDLLQRMAMTPGQVMTRLQLARGSDAEDALDSNAVDVHVYSLRKKLGARWITTVRGVGYLLEEG